MPHDLQPAFVRALYEDERTTFPVVFLEFRHESISPAIRVANDFTPLNPATPDTPNVPYLYDTKEWLAFPFEISAPSNTAGQAETRLRIQNVDRKIGQALKGIVDPVAMSLWIFSSADFELNGAGTRMIGVGTPTMQRYWPLAFVQNITVTRTEVTADIKGFDISLEPYPFIRATVARAPGLWM